jgi:hypothetical protein
MGAAFLRLMDGAFLRLKGGARRLVVLGAVAAALAIFLLILKLTPPPSPGQSVSIREGEPDEIRLLQIQNTHGAFEIRRSGEGYEVHDIPAQLVDYQRFLHLMGDCASLRAARIAASREDDLAAYGLAAPSASVLVRYASGSDLEFYIGNIEPVSKNVYFSVRGKSPVYLMNAATAYNFTCEPDAYIDRQVTEELALSSPISAVIGADFHGTGIERSISVESALYGGDEVRRKALSFGAASHLVRMGGDCFEMDQTYGVEVLGSLLGVRASGVEAYNCSNGRLAEMGFNEPWLIIDFNYVNSAEGDMRKLTLSVTPVRNGAAQPATRAEAMYLIRRNNEDIVFRSGFLPFMGVDAGKLMTRRYLSPLIMDLDGVSVAAAAVGDKLDFTLGAESNAEKTVMLNGKQFDITVFRKLYRLLTSASHDGEPAGEIGDLTETPADPLITVEYRYRDAGKPPDIIKFYRGPVRKLIAVINGKPVQFGMRDAYAARVAEACAAIKADRDFDEIW